MKKISIKGFSLTLAIVFTLTLAPITVSAATKSDSQSMDKPPTSAESLKKTPSDSKTPTVQSPTVTTATPAVTTTTPVAKTTEATVPTFGFKQTDVSVVYKSFSGKFMVSPISDNNDFVAILNTLSDNPNAKKVSVNADDSAKSIEGSFLTVFKNGVRRVYALVSNNTIQAGDEYYQIPAETYTKLKGVYTTDNKRSSYAQWLIYMRPAKITNISLDNGGGNKELDAKYIPQAAQLVRSIRVTSGESYSPKLESFATGNGSAKINLKFGEAGQYNVMIKGNTMYVESDDMHIGCKYTIVKADATKLIEALQNPTTGFGA